MSLPPPQLTMWKPPSSSSRVYWLLTTATILWAALLSVPAPVSCGDHSLDIGQVNCRPPSILQPLLVALLSGLQENNSVLMKSVLVSEACRGSSKVVQRRQGLECERATGQFLRELCAWLRISDPALYRMICFPSRR
ncbi:uncharacterized protein LOC143291910 [Babylonia areolata]|uniref:uncharacterized protein LOC143291910 n=1 Tax=Babylonia areolata TaxID=304850 RepID=UPI003FD17D9C